MPEIVKAAWLPFPVEDGYRAREDRTVIRALRAWDGVVNHGDLAVTATSPASMQTLVAPGRAIVDGDQDPTSQGSYVVAPPDSKPVTHDPSDGANPRWDVVGIQIWDNDFDGSGLTDWDRVIVKGDPAADPVVPGGPGTAAWYPLAKVWVGAGVGSITPDVITDLRERNDLRSFYADIHSTTGDAGGFSVPNAAWTLVPQSAVLFDPSGMKVGNTLVLPVSGYYLCEHRVSLNAGGFNYWLASGLFSAGGTFFHDQDIRKFDSSWPFQGIAGRMVMRWFAKGTVLGLYIWQNAGASSFIYVTDESSWPKLGVSLIGA